MRNPNSFGGISKLSGKRRNPYMARVTTGFNECGKQQYKILGYYPNRKLAMESLVEYHKNPQIHNISELTFSDVYDQFCQFKWLRENNPIPSNYKSMYKWCEPIYKTPFTQLRLNELQKILDDCPLGYVSKSLIKSLINMVYKYAVANDYVNKNYAELMVLPKQSQSEIHAPFTDDELKLLWKNNGNPSVRWWLILCYTGMRPAELQNMLIENVHLDESYMVGGSKNDFSKNRPIPIADCIKPFIKEMYDADNEYLLEFNGAKLSNKKYRTSLDDAMTYLKMEHLPHDGRHTCATNLHKVNPPIKPLTIQKVLGHTPVTITDRVYTHIDMQEMVDAVNLLPMYR